jgi:hypothetical protein
MVNSQWVTGYRSDEPWLDSRWGVGGNTFDPFIKGSEKLWPTQTPILSTSLVFLCGGNATDE